MFFWFNNIKLGARVLAAFIGVVLIVGGIVGGLGYFNVLNLSNILHEIIGQRVPSIKQATAIERFTLRALVDEKRYLLAEMDTEEAKSGIQQSAKANIDQVFKSLDELDKVATSNGDQVLLSRSQEVRKATEEYNALFSQAMSKIRENQHAEAVMKEAGDQVVSLTQAFFQAKGQDSSATARQAMVMAVDLWDTVMRTRLLSTEYIMTQDPKTWSDLELRMQQLDTQFSQLKIVSSNETDLSRIEMATNAAKEYRNAVNIWAENDKALKGTILPKMNELGQKVQESAIETENAGWEATLDSQSRAEAVVSQAVTVSVVAALIALLLGVGIGSAMARNISKPLVATVGAVKTVASGDLLRDVDDAKRAPMVKRRDEIGDLGRAMEELVGYLRSMGEAAGRVANGDLTVELQPRSEKDELGIAFKMMIANLREIVGGVAAAAAALADAAQQLSSASEQAGAATSQIAATIQEVARGNQEQSAAVQETTASVGQLTKAIDQIANGAQEQARGIQQASISVAQMNASVARVAGATREVATAASEAREAATTGGEAVKKSAQGMANIKSSAEMVRQRILELERFSEQIGSIVEAINDIADQTNLLALNAAIEAARAGEHGRGFAVVADEVRKLAERSGNSTKEIAALIAQVQMGTREAVSATEQGASEIQAGFQLAERAADALNDILAAAQEAAKQSEQISIAVKQMESASQQVVDIMESVSTVVEESTAATQEMAASSQQVTGAIEKVAAVSEETSAAAEEVSASTEEMSAQVEEVVALAQSLGKLAADLQAAVGRFKMDDVRQTEMDGERQGEVVMRRRKDDWVASEAEPGREDAVPSA